VTRERRGKEAMGKRLNDSLGYSQIRVRNSAVPVHSGGDHRY
jgi:hypothetical protein